MTIRIRNKPVDFRVCYRYVNRERRQRRDNLAFRYRSPWTETIVQTTVAKVDDATPVPFHPPGARRTTKTSVGRFFRFVCRVCCRTAKNRSEKKTTLLLPPLQPSTRMKRFKRETDGSRNRWRLCGGSDGRWAMDGPLSSGFLKT